VRALRLPAHRAMTAHLAGAYPFVAEGGLGHAGPYIGRDLFGAAFMFDPWELYAAGHLTNPNILVIGHVGEGKSSLVKTLLWRSSVFGRSAVVADPKGEYGPLAASGGRTRPPPPRSARDAARGEPRPAAAAGRARRRRSRPRRGHAYDADAAGCRSDAARADRGRGRGPPADGEGARRGLPRRGGKRRREPCKPDSRDPTHLMHSGEHGRTAPAAIAGPPDAPGSRSRLPCRAPRGRWRGVGRHSRLAVHLLLPCGNPGPVVQLSDRTAGRILRIPKTPTSEIPGCTGARDRHE
jgi:hypothetical protein